MGQLALFHHEPGRSDDAVDELLAAVRRGGCDAIAAAEGQVLDLPAAAAPPGVASAV